MNMNCDGYLTKVAYFQFENALISLKPIHSHQSQAKKIKKSHSEVDSPWVSKIASKKAKSVRR
jgi:hypothetical protein